MNKTRLQWSSEFKCRQQKKDSTTNSLLLGIVVIAGLFSFYISLYVQGMKDEERNHTFLDDSEIPGISGGRRNNPPEAVAGPSGAKILSGNDSDDDMLSCSSHSTNASLINLNDPGNSSTANLITM